MAINKSVVVDIVSDSKKFLQGYEEAISQLEKISKKANILGGMQEDIDKLKGSISELSNDIKNIKPTVNDSEIQQLLKKIGSLDERTNTLRSNIKDIKLKVDASSGDVAQKTINNMMASTQGLMSKFSELNNVVKAFHIDSDVKSIKSIDDLKNKYEQALTAFNNFSNAQKKSANGNDFSNEYKKVSEELYRFSSILNNISFEEPDFFTDEYIDNIYDSMEKASSIIKTKKALIDKELQNIDYKKIINSTTAEVGEFKLQKGKIIVPLELEKTTNQLQREANNIIDEVRKTINPVTVPIKLVSGYKTDTKNEIKDIKKQAGIDKPVQSTIDNVKRQADKEINIDIKTNINETEKSINAGIKNIQKNLQDSKLIISPSIQIEEEDRKKLQEDIITLSKKLKIDVSTKKLEESIKKLTDDNLIKEWGNTFLSVIDTICQKIEGTFTKVNESTANIFTSTSNTTSKKNSKQTNTKSKTKTQTTSKTNISKSIENDKKEISQVISLLTQMFQTLTQINNKNIDLNVEGLDTVTKRMKNLILIVSDLNKKIQAIDFSKIEISTKPLDKMTTALSEMYALLNKSFDISGFSNLENQFDILKNKFNSIAKDDGSFDARKKEVQELMDIYQKYLDMGGKQPIVDLTENKKSQQKLLNAYSKYSEKQGQAIEESKKAVNEEKQSFEEVETSATNAANAKDTFTTANQQLKESTTASISGIKEEKKALEEVNNINDIDNDNTNTIGIEDKANKVKESANEIKNALIVIKGARNNAYDNVESYEGEVVKETRELINVYKQAKDEYNSGRKTWNQAYEDMRQGFENFYSKDGWEYKDATINLAPDFGLINANVTSYNNELKQTIRDTYAIDDATKQILRTSIQLKDSGEQRANAIKKEISQIERAQKDLNDKLASFNSATVGQMQDNPIYQELSNFKINNLDDIEKAKNLLLELNSAKKNIESNARKGSSGLDPFVNMVTNINRAESAVKSIDLSYKNLIVTSSATEEKIKKLQNTLSSLKNANNIDEQAQYYGEFKTILNSITDDIKILKTESNQVDGTKIKNLIASFNSLSSTGDGKISAYVTEYQKLSNIIQQVLTLTKQLSSLDGTQYDDTVIQIKQLTSEANELSKVLHNDKFSINNNKGLVVKEDIKNAKEARLVVEQLAKELNIINGIQTKNLGNGLTEFTAKVKSAKGVVQDLTFTFDASVNTISKGIKKEETQVSGLTQVFNKLGNQFKKVFDYIISFGSFYQIWNMFKQGINIVKDLDTALTEMQKVSDETISSLKNFQKASFDIADSVGTTAKQIQESTADWMRLGESLNEATESAKTSNILFNVSEFDNIEEATESLVAMSSAYSELDKMNIVDKLNEVGNNYAISTDGIATALQKSASALKTAGNDMDEAVALVTAGNAVVQDPDSVGAGLRTISLRLTGTKEAEQTLTDLGEDTEGVITTVSKLRETIMSATAVASNGFKGFDILDENGNYKSTYEILKGISEIYQQIVETDKKTGSNNKNLLLETMAGKNRSNIAASILQNPELLENVFKSSQNAEGSALEENEKYMESIEGHLDQLINKWQELWSNTTNRDQINWFIDLAKAILDAVDNIGLLKSAFIGIAGILAIKQTTKGGGRGKIKMFPLKEYKICLRAS